MYIMLWGYVNDVTQTLLNKERFWLTLMLLRLEMRPKSHDISMFCIEKCKHLGMLVSTKATTLIMQIVWSKGLNICFECSEELSNLIEMIILCTCTICVVYRSYITIIKELSGNEISE